MKNVNISSKSIGSNIVAESATVQSLSAHVISNDAKDQAALIDLLAKQAMALQSASQGFSPDQLRVIGDQIAKAVAELKAEPEKAKKVDIFKKSLAAIKFGAGLVEALESFLKLGSSLGVTPT
jgi:hypothetical protein